jgi:hypothetical protein
MVTSWRATPAIPATIIVSVIEPTAIVSVTSIPASFVWIAPPAIPIAGVLTHGHFHFLQALGAVCWLT